MGLQGREKSLMISLSVSIQYQYWLWQMDSHVAVAQTALAVCRMGKNWVLVLGHLGSGDLTGVLHVLEFSLHHRHVHHSCCIKIQCRLSQIIVEYQPLKRWRWERATETETETANWNSYKPPYDSTTDTCLYTVYYTDLLDYWHQRADERHGNPPQGNQELLVVRDKVGRPPGELGVNKSMECDILPSVHWQCWLGDRHPACKKLDVGLLVVMIWLELCMTYSSSRVVTTTSIILCFNKQRLTHVHLENGH